MTQFLLDLLAKLQKINPIAYSVICGLIIAFYFLIQYNIIKVDFISEEVRNLIALLAVALMGAKVSSSSENSSSS